jgi:uncharacterized damage-inducible protein DinB
MLTTIRDLVLHKSHANAAILTSIQSSQAAATDPAVIQVLQHILMANRFWLLTIMGQSFAREIEQDGVPETFDALVAAFRRTHREEVEWFAQATDVDLERVLEDRQIPVARCSVVEGVLQVVLHTQGHRAQLAKMLRGHGVTPPVTDFVLWVGGRPEPAWPTLPSDNAGDPIISRPSGQGPARS